MMDGDVREGSRSFAKTNYGGLTFINKNIDGNKVISLILNEEQWEKQLRADLDKFYNEDPLPRVCIVSQRSSKTLALYNQTNEQPPHLAVNKVDDGGTTRAFF